MTDVNTDYSEDLAQQVSSLDPPWIWGLPHSDWSPSCVAAYGLQLVMLAPSTPHTSSQEN